MARTRQRGTAELLQLYVLEGFLRHLVHSPHRDRFVLKGGVLLAAFDLRRPTRDVDLLALWTDRDPVSLGRLIAEIVSTGVDDGVVFQQDTLNTAAIRDDEVYPGLRIVLEARLATAVVRFNIDLNVGDPVVPFPVRTNIPALLGTEPIVVLAYPKAMVIAEKLVTALQRGRANTRWRDFADLFLLSSGSPQADQIIVAVRAVDSHRGVIVRPLGEVLAEMSNEAQPRWATWHARQAVKGRIPEQFSEVLRVLDERSRAWLVEADSSSSATLTVPPVGEE
jgi:hypothetical protein